MLKLHFLFTYMQKSSEVIWNTFFPNKLGWYHDKLYQMVFKNTLSFIHYFLTMTSKIEELEISLFFHCIKCQWVERSGFLLSAKKLSNFLLESSDQGELSVRPSLYRSYLPSNYGFIISFYLTEIAYLIII